MASDAERGGRKNVQCHARESKRASSAKRRKMFVWFQARENDCIQRKAQKSVRPLPSAGKIWVFFFVHNHREKKSVLACMAFKLSMWVN